MVDLSYPRLGLCHSICQRAKSNATGSPCLQECSTQTDTNAHKATQRAQVGVAFDMLSPAVLLYAKDIIR